MPTNEVALIASADAQNQLARLNEQDAKSVKALAAQFNYKGPIDPDSLETLCQSKGIAAGCAIFEYGSALLMLRESCLHGDWMVRFERMAISRRTAHNYMTIAMKFKDADVQTALSKLGVSKILELATLEDDEVKALTNGETVRGVTIEKAEKLSVKELRKQIEDKDRVIATYKKDFEEKRDELIALQTSNGTKISADINWPDALEPISDQIAACKRDIDHIFSKLESARIAVLQVEMSEDQRPKFEAALAHVAEIYASALVSAERHYLKDQVIFAQTLGAFLADGE